MDGTCEVGNSSGSQELIFSTVSEVALSKPFRVQATIQNPLKYTKLVGGLQIFEYSKFCNQLYEYRQKTGLFYFNPFNLSNYKIKYL